jgi:hypothetical protein
MRGTHFLIFAGKIMTEQRFYLPLKIGLLIVAVAYFLFTFHGMFTLSWIGEWNLFPGYFSFWLFITDISAAITFIFRLIGSIIAVSAVIAYFVKKGLSAPMTLKLLKWILICEAIYWLGLLTSGVGSILPVGGLPFYFDLLITSGIPCSVAATAIPIALFKLVSKLNPNKPAKGAIKWGLIAGTVYIFVFWLNNTAMWLYTVMHKGTEYLTVYPENLLSFGLTTVGMLALALFTAYFSKKSIGTETLEKLNLKTVGANIVALGLYFLWNYLTWIFFGRPELWSDWYAWFLGHNMDLWVMLIPLVGLPLLFERKAEPSP